MGSVVGPACGADNIECMTHTHTTPSTPNRFTAIIFDIEDLPVDYVGVFDTHEEAYEAAESAMIVVGDNDPLCSNGLRVIVIEVASNFAWPTGFTVSDTDIVDAEYAVDEDADIEDDSIVNAEIDWHQNRMDIIEAIRSHPEFGRGTCSIIDECYTDDELISTFAFEGWDDEGYRIQVSLKDAVRNAEIAHEIWADRMAEADQYIDRDYFID